MIKKSIALLLISAYLLACSTTKIYVVRHAEKNGTASNADLKIPNGFARAATLKDSMLQKKLHGVYSTNTPRTIHTAEPTAIANNLQVELYANADSLLQNLLLRKGKNYLVVGHSNTVPQMIRKLGLPISINGNIPDDDFDNLFIITKKWGLGKSKLTLTQKTYGEISPISY